MSVKERDVAVDWVKFFAVFIIINSHADKMYPHFQILATGGAVGDCLFLFCSGFTLFLGQKTDFGTYYKRRISRIYPTVFMAVIFDHLIRMNYQVSMCEFMGRVFIRAIMIYYVFLFFIREYAIDRVKTIVGIVALITLIVYFLWFPYKYETSIKGLYGVKTYFRWIPYFAAMLIGAYVGMNRKTMEYNFGSDFLKLLICLICFYGIQFAAKVYRPIAPAQIVTIVPLMGIVVYVYKCCNCSFLRNVYENPKGKYVVLAIGGLCLESYLVQNCLFTAKMNNIWPFNLIIITIVILVCAYVVRCFARLFIQTFQKESYNWKAIFAVV